MTLTKKPVSHHGLDQAQTKRGFVLLPDQRLCHESGGTSLAHQGSLIRSSLPGSLCNLSPSRRCASHSQGWSRREAVGDDKAASLDTRPLGRRSPSRLPVVARPGMVCDGGVAGLLLGCACRGCGKRASAPESTMGAADRPHGRAGRATIRRDAAWLRGGLWGCGRQCLAGRARYACRLCMGVVREPGRLRGQVDAAGAWRGTAHAAQAWRIAQRGGRARVGGRGR